MGRGRAGIRSADDGGGVDGLDRAGPWPKLVEGGVANEDPAAEAAVWDEGAPLVNGELRMYAWRWPVLLCVFFTNMVNAGLWLSYSPISDLVHEKYGVPETVVNILSYCMGGLYGPVVWSAAPVVKRIGFANACRGAAFVTCLGAILRCFAVGHSTFFFLVLGQVSSGLGRPVVTQLLVLVSQNWFAPRQRALATTIASLGNPMGIGLGFVLPPMLTHNDANNITKMHIVFAAIAGAMLLWVLVFVRERPPTPPSESANIDPAIQKTYGEELRHLARSPMYWLNAVSFGIAFGQSFALAILMNQFLKPFGYGHGAVGICGVMVILPGIVGAGIIAGYLAKHPNYKQVLITLYVVCAGFMQFVIWLAARENLGNYNFFLLFGSGVFGFFVQPAFAVALELASETVFPVSPATASAGVIMCAQYTGLLMSIGLAQYIDSAGDDAEKRRKVHVSGCIMSGAFALGATMMLFFNAPQLRRQYDQRGRAARGDDEAPTAAACAQGADDDEVRTPTDLNVRSPKALPSLGGKTGASRSSRAATLVASTHEVLSVGTPVW